ncbi:MAG: phage capsid family protein, partial [Candidatus Syntropharchaeales archaeon]
MGKVMRKEYTENGQPKVSGLPSGNVIEHQDFSIDGYKDTVLIPMLLNLNQAPAYGDQYLVGTGEKADLKYMRGALNQVAAVVNVKDGNMSRFRDMGALRVYREAIELLTNRMKEYDNAHIISALYEGHSSNVTAGLSVAPKGIGMTAHYHPNMYVNQIATDGTSGELAEVGTEKRNKTAAEIYSEVYTNYDSITYPSVYMLEAISRKLESLKIKPVKTWGGKPLYLMIVDTPTFYRLRRDSNIKAAITAGWTGVKKFNSPLFTWDYFVYDRYLILSDTLSARSFDTTTSTFSGSSGRYYDLPTL